MKDKKNKPKIDKEDFIDFLSHCTPEEINQLIIEQGKPNKPIEPMYFFDKYDENN